MACFALFVALGGSSYAARTPVGSGQIEKSAVRSKHVKDGSLPGKDVRNDSLTGADVDESTLNVTGQQGPQGPPGPAGAPGTQAAGVFAVVDGAHSSVVAGSSPSTKGRRTTAEWTFASIASSPAVPMSPA
jgi:hypothetical protein